MLVNLGSYTICYDFKHYQQLYIITSDDIKIVVDNISQRNNYDIRFISNNIF
jgi:hypothetical protein